jgi:hypothetical protein
MVIGPGGIPRIGTGAGLTAAEIAGAIPIAPGKAGVEQIVKAVGAMLPKRAKPSRKTVRAAIRGSVPGGKLRKAKIILAERAQLAGSPIGGFTEYDQKNRRDVVKLGAPLDDSAEGITIRGHETRHATRHTPTRKKPVSELEALIGQVVDDVNIESTDLPQVSPGLLKPYKRAHLTTAMKGVRVIKNTARKVKAGVIPDAVPLRNGQLIHSVRTIAMLKHYGQPDFNNGDYAGMHVKDRGLKKIRDAIGHRMLNAVSRIATMAISRRKRAKAISMLLALMESEPNPEIEEGEEGPKGDGDFLLPEQDGDALDGHMQITDLKPKSVYCAKEKSISMRKTPNGVIINPSRYVAAIVSGDANGLFSKRVRQKPGGCVMIDASGSMGASRENLSALCKLVPQAVVAYYSGSGYGKGELCVYANKGMRFADELPEGTLHGGNAVDLPAIRWMMRFPKPWVLVSDLKFCGGVLGSEDVAKAIVERETRNGNLKVYRSLDEAYEAFGGKGPLRN